MPLLCQGRGKFLPLPLPPRQQLLIFFTLYIQFNTLVLHMGGILQFALIFEDYSGEFKYSSSVAFVNGSVTLFQIVIDHFI